MEKQSDLIKKGDWNTLVILDACRYDVFKKVIDTYDGFFGNLKPVKTNSIDTPEWYINNWVGKKGTEDAVLISANPQSFRYGELKFKTTVRAWNHLASALKVHPENTLAYYYNYALMQRAVIHFIPPHIPYLGDKGVQLNAKLKINPLRNPMNLGYELDVFTKYGQKNGWDEIKKCYEENLKIIIPLVTSLYTDYLAPVVITSDHGECLGEGGKFGHSHKELELQEIQTTVPWFEYDDEKIKYGVCLKGLGYADVGTWSTK